MASMRMTSAAAPRMTISPFRYFWVGFRSPQNRSHRSSLVADTTRSGFPDGTPAVVPTISPSTMRTVKASPVSRARKWITRDQPWSIRRSLALPLHRMA